jgi:zinc protease
MRSLAFLAALVLLAFLAPAVAQAQPLPADPRVLTGTCDNGLKYIVVRHNIPPLRAQLWLRVDAGSLHEADDQRGAAHLLSHLAFAGSENYPTDSVGPFLESLGMRSGADLNSYTTFTDSVYKLSLREATPDAVGKSLAFLRDIAQNLALPVASVEKERAALLAEQKNAATIDQRVQEFLLANLVPGSLIGQRLRLGTPDGVNALTPENVRAFYKRWYVPSNMTVIFVGDMPPDQVVPLITGTIGAGKNVPTPPRPSVKFDPATAPRAAVISDAELTTARVYLLKPAPVLPAAGTVPDLRRRVLDSLAVGAFNRRLDTKATTGKLGFPEAAAFSSDLSGLCQLTGMYIASEPGKWRDAMKTLGVELQRARLHGLYPSEVEETKKRFLSQAEQNVTNETLRQGTAYVAALNAGSASGDALMSAQQTFDQLKSIFDSLDTKAVSEHFKALMDPQNALFLFTLPSTGEIPDQAAALAAGTQALAVSPEAETEFVKPTALMTKAPTPGTVAEESTHEASGVWSAWLSNGVRVHHKLMTTAPGQATITVGVAGGLIEETDVTRGLTEAGSVAWTRPATSTLPSFAIQELLEGKDIRLGGGPGMDNLLLAVSGPVQDLEMGLQLLHLLLTDPLIEGPALDQWKKTQGELADSRRSQPREVFSDTMLDLVYPASEARPRPMTREQVERVTLEGAQGWIRRQVSTGPIEVSVVGDIPRERASELVRTYVGSLPARPRISSSVFADKRAIAFPKEARTARREVAGLTPTSFIMAGFRGTDAQNLPDARLLGLASQVLTARLQAEFQIKEKLVQNVIVQSQPAQEFPGSGMFGAFAPIATDKADDLTQRIFKAFDEFATSGPSIEELSHAKDDVTHQLQAALANPEFWTGQLSLLDYRGVPLDALADATAPYTAITPADVKAAFNKYYTPETRMQLHLVQIQDATKVKPVERGIPVRPNAAPKQPTK